MFVLFLFAPIIYYSTRRRINCIEFCASEVKSFPQKFEVLKSCLAQNLGSEKFSKLFCLVEKVQAEAPINHARSDKKRDKALYENDRFSGGKNHLKMECAGKCRECFSIKIGVWVSGCSVMFDLFVFVLFSTSNDGLQQMCLHSPSSAKKDYKEDARVLKLN